MTPKDLVFIVNFVSPIYLMLLFRLKTKRLNLMVPLLFAGSLMASPLAIHIYLTNITASLYVAYWYMFAVLVWLLRRAYDAPQAVSVAAMTVFLSSFLWELPWLVRNALLVGFEWDWLLHVLGLFYVWFLHEYVGFKRIAPMMMVLTVSAAYMLLTRIPPMSADPYVWNSAMFMGIRVASAASVYASLKVRA